MIRFEDFLMNTRYGLRLPNSHAIRYRWFRNFDAWLPLQDTVERKARATTGVCSIQEPIDNIRPEPSTRLQLPPADLFDDEQLLAPYRGRSMRHQTFRWRASSTADQALVSRPVIRWPSPARPTGRWCLPALPAPSALAQLCSARGGATHRYFPAPTWLTALRPAVLSKPRQGGVVAPGAFSVFPFYAVRHAPTLLACSVVQIHSSRLLGGHH